MTERFAAERDIDARARMKCAKMSLAEKAGQVLMLNLNPHLDDSEKIIKTIKPGGIVMVTGRVPAIAERLNELQGMSSEPLLVAASYERGAGTFTHGATDLPSAMGLGATHDPEYARRAGSITGIESSALGIHCLFAPVCDINTNPKNPIINVRSFSDNPELAGSMALAWLEGAQESRVVCSIKHFPGQGNSPLDTHTHLAPIPGTKRELLRTELRPFLTVLDSGSCHAVMTAHIWAPALDRKRRPATMSPVIINGWLKASYPVCVFTDALDMGGITADAPPDEALIGALNAGCDMLVMPLNMWDAPGMILNAVKKGRLPIDRLDDAVCSILRLKAMLRLNRQRRVNVSRISERVATTDLREQALDVARNTLTLVVNKKNILPVSPRSNVAVLGMVNKKGQTMIWQDNYDFGTWVNKQCPSAKHLFLGESVDESGTRKALELVTTSHITILALFPRVIIGGGEICFSKDQIALLRKIAKKGKSLVAVSFGSPYIINDIPAPDAFLCSFSNADVVQQATAEALFGKTNPTGRLPVHVNDKYPFGHGLSYK